MQTYDDAIKVLENIYIKHKNEILARHLLAIRKQRADETVKEYIQALKLLTFECLFKAVTAEEHQNESARSSLV